jgi:hypothetical protein
MSPCPGFRSTASSVGSWPPCREGGGGDSIDQQCSSGRAFIQADTSAGFRNQPVALHARRDGRSSECTKAAGHACALHANWSVLRPLLSERTQQAVHLRSSALPAAPTLKAHHGVDGLSSLLCCVRHVVNRCFLFYDEGSAQSENRTTQQIATSNQRGDAAINSFDLACESGSRHTMG